MGHFFSIQPHSALKQFGLS